MRIRPTGCSCWRAWKARATTASPVPDADRTPGLFQPSGAPHSAHDFHEWCSTTCACRKHARRPGRQGLGHGHHGAAYRAHRPGHYERRRGLDHAVSLLKERGQFDDPAVQARRPRASPISRRAAAGLQGDRRPGQAGTTERLTTVARVAMIRSNHMVANFIAASSRHPGRRPAGDGRLQYCFKYTLITGLGAGAAEVHARHGGAALAGAAQGGLKRLLRCGSGGGCRRSAVSTAPRAPRP